MASPAKQTRVTIIPALRYRDARGAIEFLCTAFGFEKSLVVADRDAHCARAKDSGAEILMKLTNQDYGGRDYTARDPEGHVWTFVTLGPSSSQA